MTRGERGGDYRGKGEGFAATTIKDTWTITRRGGNRGGRWRGHSGVGKGGGKDRKLYLNNNKKNKIKF